jgi:uncharacterized protein YbcC (UPF0753/DUF2309 family)
MSIPLGLRLKIRAMIHVAAEPIPYFWPMRTFIHHNPLHGLEHLPFEQAAQQGAKLFHGRAFLPRRIYQRYLSEGKVDKDSLSTAIARFLASRHGIADIDLQHWLTILLTEVSDPVTQPNVLADTPDVHACLQGREPGGDAATGDTLRQYLHDRLLGDRPIYEAVDALYGTEVGAELDELMIKSCLDFFDEGQSVWEMPGRENGLFSAWCDMANRNVPFYLHGLHVSQILEQDERPEGVIAYVLEQLGVPRERWVGYFTHELGRLHGWAGFVKWRSSAKHYYWADRFPADLVHYVAIRLAMALALLRKDGRQDHPWTTHTIAEAINQRTAETFLRHELHVGLVLPAMAHKVDQALLRGNDALITQVLDQYLIQKTRDEAQTQADRLLALATAAGARDALLQLNVRQLAQVLDAIRVFEQQEGMTWLKALEARAMTRLLHDLDTSPDPVREKRPFAQALFCIDTRSERIRRHLEDIGDYQTFGIAGFFGVPVSFMELGKGSETHLCPVILTPKNLVPEITAATRQDDAAVTALEKAMHELKESVLTPFVTVEAIGLLFGFDMIGKTVAPQTYNRWRKRLHPDKPFSRLLLDKLSREQADSIVRAVQRTVIVKALEQEFELSPERVTDDMIRSLRESALGHQETLSNWADGLGLDAERAAGFIVRLRTAYRINDAFAHRQLERLGRIGFTVDEQVNYVTQALSSIGLTKQFSRFVLLVGHGSSSENNPYESALDCGACGGNRGLVSAKVLAQMANKSPVRRVLRARGINIPDDTWFLPAYHDTTTDEIRLHNLELIPPSHLVYIDRLRNGLTAASRLCAAERVPTLELDRDKRFEPGAAFRRARRNSLDWSQVRPEWGLSQNLYFVIGRRHLTEQATLNGRAFLHSYDYRIDPKQRLLENILTGPLVVGQWINMEHYFSTVDNECFGSGSKVNHNVAGRFGVMTGNLSDLRTGLPSQTVLRDGEPYHEPLRLITVIEAPFEHAEKAVYSVVAVKNLVQNGWIRLLIVDSQTGEVSVYQDGEWQKRALHAAESVTAQESVPL